MANIYQLGDLSDCLSFDGVTLCNFNEQEFILLTGSEDTGRKVAAQLDLWKNGKLCLAHSCSRMYNELVHIDSNECDFCSSICCAIGIANTF